MTEGESAISEQQLWNLGARYFKQQIWTTALSTDQLSASQEAIHAHGYGDIQIVMVRPNLEVIESVAWAHSFSEDGDPIAHELMMRRSALGRYLKLTIGWSKPESEDLFDRRCRAAINLLRIAFGTTAAVDKVYASTVYQLDSGPSRLSDVGFASPIFGMNTNKWTSPQDIQVEEIGNEVSTLIDAAMGQEAPLGQFLLLWTAHEAAIRDRFGPNARRAKFYLDELGSEIINKEVHRLFKEVRNPLLKEGRLNYGSIGRDIHSLFIALQVIYWKDCESRKEIVAGYEAFISQQSVT